MQRKRMASISFGVNFTLTDTAAQTIRYVVRGLQACKTISAGDCHLHIFYTGLIFLRQIQATDGKDALLAYVRNMTLGGPLTTHESDETYEFTMSVGLRDRNLANFKSLRGCMSTPLNIDTPEVIELILLAGLVRTSQTMEGRPKDVSNYSPLTVNARNVFYRQPAACPVNAVRN